MRDAAGIDVQHAGWMMPSAFRDALFRRVTKDLVRFQVGNVDGIRFPRSSSPWHRQFKRVVVEGMDGFFARLGYVRYNAYHREHMEERIAQVERIIDGLEWLYGRLGDDASRKTLVEVMAYRIAGARHTRLSRNNDAYALALDALHTKAMLAPRVARTKIMDGWLDDYDLSECGFPVRLRAHRLGVLNTFLLQQYRFDVPGAPVVEVRPGDIVVDGGGAWGDTALYFAWKAGEAGQVHVFEFARESLELLRANVHSNPGLAARIRIHGEALWDVSGLSLSSDSSRITDSSFAAMPPVPNSGEANSMALDDLLGAETFATVDFIKLDVEGAEARCIRGARNIIRTCKPRAAIALYHSLEDFVELPQLLDSYVPGYRFSLAHFTIHAEETILFAALQ